MDQKAYSRASRALRDAHSQLKSALREVRDAFHWLKALEGEADNALKPETLKPSRVSRRKAPERLTEGKNEDEDEDKNEDEDEDDLLF